MEDTRPRIDLTTAMAALMKGTKAERSWDKVLGGPTSRPYRDVATWAVQRLLGGGASLEDVLEYLRGAAALEE